MTIEAMDKLLPKVRARAVWKVLEHEGEHAFRWTAVCSIAGKTVCTAQTLKDWVKTAEIDSGACGRADGSC